MLKEILNFFSSPYNITFIVFLLLGILMIVYSQVGKSIERRKNIIAERRSGKKQKVGFLDQILDKSEFMRRYEDQFRKRVSVLDIEYDARKYTKLKLYSGLAGILVAIYLKNIYVVIPLILIGTSIPTAIIEMKIKKRVSLFNDQILEAFQMFITEYTTTRSVQRTIVDIGPKLKNPLRKEFERLARKLNSGEPVEECFVEFAERTQNKWTLIFAQLMITYFRNGGDFTEQLLNITKSITNEKILDETNSTELSSMRIINIAMNALVPIAYISNKFINPQDANVFVETGIGKTIMFCVVIACSISLYIGKKITDA